MELIGDSAKLPEFAAAMARAQGAVTGAIKDAKNPHLNSKYADLESVWAACRAALTGNGLSVVQMPARDEFGVTVETLVLHQSGVGILSRVSCPLDKATPQQVGSLLTYLRRYALSAVAGIAPSDDDDAQSVETVARQAPRRAAAPVPRSAPLEAMAVQAPAPPSPPLSDAQLKMLCAVARQKFGCPSSAEIRALLAERELIEVASLRTLTSGQASGLISKWEALPDYVKPPVEEIAL